MAVASAEGDSTQEEKEKKGCCSEQRVLIPLEQDGSQDLQYPTMKTCFLLTVLPEQCVCVCEPTVSLTHTWGRGVMVFFPPAAYQVSPGFSVVAAAIHRG